MIGFRNNFISGGLVAASSLFLLASVVGGGGVRYREDQTLYNLIL
jgi:hypothetical protein